MGLQPKINGKTVERAYEELDKLVITKSSKVT